MENCCSLTGRAGEGELETGDKMGYKFVFFCFVHAHIVLQSVY